jgi:CRP-like cAMP-binding protein
MIQGNPGCPHACFHVHEERSLISNLILSALSPDTRQSLLDRCTAVALPLRTYLYVPDVVPAYAYFITSGMASIVATLPSDATVEVEIVCHEGLVGSMHLLGDAPISNNCFMQIEGTALRIELAQLQELFFASMEIRTHVLAYIQRQALVVSQMVACNRLHDAEQRLALWLLMASDRTSSNILDVSQEFLGEMIGTRRTTVTAIITKLQKKNLIVSGRRRVSITDKVGLKQAACYCYKIVSNLSNGRVHSKVPNEA